MIIAICGNIASGKTTLAKYICDNYDFCYIPNQRIEYDFLEDFFGNISERFLQTQLAFLISKALQIKDAYLTGKNIVIDRSLEEDINVFAKMWIDNYNVDQRIQNLYMETAKYIVSSLPAVDIYIMCKCLPMTSRQRLQKRKNRDYEKKYPNNHIEKIYQYLQDIEFPSSSTYIQIDSERCDFCDEKIVEKLVVEIFESYNFEIDKRYYQFNIFDNEIKEPNGLKTHSYIDEIKLGEANSKLEIIKQKKIVYIAAPFTGLAVADSSKNDTEPFGSLEREHGVLPKEYQRKLERIRKLIIEEWDARVILPHKDVNKWGNKELSSDVVLKNVLKNITESDIIIAIPSVSIGVHFEIGIALAQHKPIIVFDVQELDRSFYVKNFDVLNEIKKFKVEKIDDIYKILRRKEVWNFLKLNIKKG